MDDADMRGFVEKYMPPKEYEKKAFGEVFTPLTLVEEILGKIRPAFWTNPNLKILDPAAGIGNFPLVAYEKLMKGLVMPFPNVADRKRHIIDNMLYMIEINPTNVKVMKKLFNSKVYKVNVFLADGLADETIARRLGGAPFDLIMGNPPYQDTIGNNGTLWDKFVLKYLPLVAKDRYLAFVHPSGWRNVTGKFKAVQLALRERQLVYLEIHNERDGIALFRSSTRFDWYLLKNCASRATTRVKFQTGEVMDVDLSQLDFIPNAQFDLFQRLLARSNERATNVLYDTTYHIQHDRMRREKTAVFRYPCVYTISVCDEPTFFYSNVKKRHFGIPKLIWSNGAGTIVDKKGDYGMTQFAFAIVDKAENLEKIKKAFDSAAFRAFMESCAVGQNAINHKVIGLFKADWYHHFA